MNDEPMRLNAEQFVCEWSTSCFPPNSPVTLHVRQHSWSASGRVHTKTYPAPGPLDRPERENA